MITLAPLSMLFQFAYIASLLALVAPAVIPDVPVSRKPEPVTVTGNTMGTTYHITYFDKKGRNFKTAIDSLLLAINRSISNYDPHSEVSKFNQSPRGVPVDLPYFSTPLQVSYEVYKASGGALDLTVMPLVNAWGFGPGREMDMTREKVDSIRQFVGFDKVQIRSDSVIKIDQRVQIDFGGVGQGYGADVIAAFLKKKRIANYLIEIGGEGVAAGRNLKTNRRWRIGILDPASTLDNQFFKAYVYLRDGGFTTAGNYFNFREVNGKKYSHTIDPVSGYPAEQRLLSVSVFAADGLTADAWDTAFMVMGHEKTIEWLKKHPQIQALLFYTDDEGAVSSYATPALAKLVVYER